MKQHSLHFAALLGLVVPPVQASQDGQIRVGAKSFTEQQILGELVAQLIERHTRLSVQRRFDLGGTGVCHAALIAGELDVYVEYTGTALSDILRLSMVNDPDEAFRSVAQAYRERFDAVWLPPLGFSNTYVLTVRSEHAQARGWSRITDLKGHASSLKAGFTSEFAERPDGYPGLRRAYGLRFGTTIDLDPGLMYSALARGEVDVICAFLTDGRLLAYDLRPLHDDLQFFPPYEAAPVVRGTALRRHPEIGDALISLIRGISSEQMQRLNLEVDEKKRLPRAVAREWIQGRTAAGTIRPAQAETAWRGGPAGFFRLVVQRRGELAGKIREHLVLTVSGVIIAVLVGLPLGIAIYRLRALAPVVLAATEIIQTIPSLAMLAFLFALYRVLGATPAVTALVLYSLLPIVLNTYTGLSQTPAEVREAAMALGMSWPQRLRLVEMPLALPVIVAGIRTACVWTVGIATLSTYIGAGGLGDFISRGLARNDPSLTLLGAVPAALIAVALSLLVRMAERGLKRW